MPRPKFVTFTGIDGETDLSRVKQLSERYPIEWGVLVGGTGNRHPPMHVVEALAAIDGLRVALHLCKRYSAAALDGDTRVTDFVTKRRFGRVQVNAGKYNIPDLVRFQSYVHRPVIMQARGRDFPPAMEGVQFLHDLSNGNGLVPKFRPTQYPDMAMVGYAGGIGPINVAYVTRRLRAHDFWIDMETKIRSNGWLDLTKCEEVCQKIWPPPKRRVSGSLADRVLKPEFVLG